MVGKSLEELPIPKHTGPHEKKREPFGSTPATGKPATLTLGYLIKVRLHEVIPKSPGQSGVSCPDTYILLRVTCHYAKGSEHRGIVPDLILTVWRSTYDCLGSETSDLVSETQC